MLSAVITWEHSYSAVPEWLPTTDTPGVPSSQSSRTRDNSSQVSTVMQDRDRTGLRRSEPSSRTLLTGEQPDPWDLLQPQDRMSRHRCLPLITKSTDYTFILLTKELVVYGLSKPESPSDLSIKSIRGLATRDFPRYWPTIHFS